MKIGMMGLRGGRRNYLQRAIDEAKALEADGFHGIYAGNAFGHDALTLLTLLGPATSAIELGTAVVPIQTRQPYAMAQQVLSMAAAFPGRLNLGLGLSHAVMVEALFGVDYDRPARRMREYLQVLMPLIESREVKVSGEFYSCEANLQIEEVEPFRVTLAALGPRMLRLAGELTDGTFLWMCGPRTMRGYVVPTISEAASAAGKPDPMIMLGLPLLVTDDVAEARKRAASELAFYDDLPSYREMLGREGLDRAIDMAVIGGEDEVLERIAAYEAAGCTNFNAYILPSGEETYRRTVDCLKHVLQSSPG